MSAHSRKLVVYTVLTGAKEPLGNPVALLPPDASSDLELSFVCFTDNPTLRSPVWEMRLIDALPLPSEKLSRRPKALPHEYLDEWSHSLYIDNITQFKRLPQAADLVHCGDYLFKAFRHETRNTPQQEGEAIVQLGYESADKICGQLDFYAARISLDSITPLSTCTVLLREHSHPMVQSHSLIWWEQILAFGKRDQMSFDFALQAAGARLEHLPGWKHDSDLIHDTPNIQPNRVHANFDPVRYAWAHRGDAAAQADPRRHYLEQGRLEWRRYSVPAELLEFLCHRQRSSLGARIAPRRAMAAGLQDLLQARSLQQGRLLVLRVSEGGALGFEAEELDRAEQALVAFLAGHRGARLEVKAAELASGRLALRAGEHEFDLLLLIGLPGELLEQALILVRASLAPAGLLVAMCCSSASLAKLAEFEAAIAAQRGPVRSSVHASRHDGLDAPLSNSLLAFEWGG